MELWKTNIFKVMTNQLSVKNFRKHFVPAISLHPPSQSTEGMHENSAIYEIYIVVQMVLVSIIILEINGFYFLK